MAEFEQRKSGLITPVEKKKRERKRRALEVDSSERREKVSKAMLQLWDALELSHFRKLDSPVDHGNHDEHRRLYEFIGKTLLGDDCPFRAELT